MKHYLLRLLAEVMSKNQVTRLAALTLMREAINSLPDDLEMPDTEVEIPIIDRVGRGLGGGNK